MSDFPPAPKRRIDAEHILQVRLRLWVREAVVSPHKFFAFDRSAARGQWTHAREKARGIQRSTPDTLLCLQDEMLWAELKDPRLNLDDDRFRKRWPDQWQMGMDLIDIGHSWHWFQSVVAYYEWLIPGIDLTPNANFLAVQADATVASLIEAAELKRGVLPKRLRVAKGPRPTVSQVRRAERARMLP